jgi:hypothetical protein
METGASGGKAGLLLHQDPQGEKSKVRSGIAASPPDADPEVLITL